MVVAKAVADDSPVNKTADSVFTVTMLSDLANIAVKSAVKEMGMGRNVRSSRWLLCLLVLLLLLLSLQR
jgi:hypothetical protein